MLYLIYAVFFGSILFFIMFFVPEDKKRPNLAAVMNIEDERDRKIGNISLAHLKPLTSGKISSFLNRLNKGSGREKLAYRLSFSGIVLNPEEFFLAKVLLVPVILVAAHVLAGGIDMPKIFIGIAVAWFLPEIWLNRQYQRRQREILKKIPETIDLLYLCVSGGLDFIAGLHFVIQTLTISNPFVKELARVLQEINVGKPRREALKDMSKRLNISEISSFVRVLIQAESMGTSVAEALRQIAEEASFRRFQRAEKIALLAPVKMLFPLVFFIMPVVGIIVAGPIFLQFMQGGFKF